MKAKEICFVYKASPWINWVQCKERTSISADIVNRCVMT